MPVLNIKAKAAKASAKAEGIIRDVARGAVGHVLVVYEKQAARIYYEGALGAEKPTLKPNSA